MNRIIGRKSEIEKLQGWHASGRAEFIAVYGRRRVGKTYLLREMFRDEFVFFHTGLSPIELKGKALLSKQLSSFALSLREYGLKENTLPADWFEAFSMLRQLLSARRNGGRQVVFIDEMPWLDTPKSQFITALEHFWNSWGSAQEDLMFLVCGSATSWITDKLLNNHGGLYGRLTGRLHLSPFNLRETEEFLNSRGISYSRYDILQCYMTTGGIPYYLEQFGKGKSVAQNIDAAFFEKDAILADEFNQLFASLFVSPERYKELVRQLGKKRDGLTRKELESVLSFSTGGGLSVMLKTLQENNFIDTNIPFGESSREMRYRLTDLFIIFFLHFLDLKAPVECNFWQSNNHMPVINAWRGLAFENICFNHTEQIKEALGIRGVATQFFTWQSKQRQNGAQIDMLVKRADRIINICEIKYSIEPYEITREYDEKLRHKIALFSSETNTRMSIVMTFISTFGILQNIYSGDVQNSITADDLFR